MPNGKLWNYLDPSTALRMTKRTLKMTKYNAQDDKRVSHSEWSESVIEESRKEEIFRLANARSR